MPTRLSLACLIAVVLTLSGRTGHAAEPLVTRTYQVADLVVPVDKHPLVVRVSAKPAARKSKPQSVPTQEALLVRLVEKAVAPHTWIAAGGPGSVAYYPLGMSLVVQQTADVHEQVERLLTVLRELQAAQVKLAVSVVAVSEPTGQRLAREFGIPLATNPQFVREVVDGLERVGIDFDATDRAVRRAKVLNRRDLARMMEMLQGDQGSNVLMAPKMTVMDGQKAMICLDEFLTGVNQVRRGDQVVSLADPKRPLGLRLSVRPEVAADGRSVRLAVRAGLTDDDAEQPSGFAALGVKKTVSVKDGATVVLAGWQVRRAGFRPVNSSVISTLPYVCQMFCPDVYLPSEKVEQVMLLITPQVLAAEEETVASPPTARK